nr:hypothetical protein [Klebsiella variicola]
MVERYNTGNSRPSNSMKDLSDNAKAYDDFMNSENDTFIDRLENEKDTLAGAQKKMAAQLSEQEIAFDYQLHQQAQMFTTAMLEQKNAWEDQMEDQKDEFIDLLTSSGFSWLNDYVDGPVTFFNRSQVTVYQGVAYRLASSTPIGFTTTGTNAASWVNDKSKLVPIG